MEKLIDLSIKVILISASFYFGLRLIRFLLDQWLEKHSLNKNKKSIDMDSLIEQKKQLLKEQGFIGSIAQNENGKMPLPSSANTLALFPNEKFYKQRLDNLKKEVNTQSQDYQDAKEILSLFSNAKWGEGKSFVKIKNNLESQLKFEVNSFDITKATNWLLKNDYFCLGKQFTIPVSFKQCLSLIESYVLFDLLVELEKKDAQDKRDILAKSMSINQEHLQLALSFFLSKQAITPALLSNKVKLNSILIKLEKEQLLEIKMSTIIKDHSRIISAIEILEAIKKLAFQLKALTPIGDTIIPGESELNRSYRILGLRPVDEIETVKMAYKNLAKVFHPDKLPNQFKDSFKTISQENFNLIKNAYEFILKEKKST